MLMEMQWPWEYSGISALHPRTVDQSNQVNVCFWPSNLECNMGNETGAPLGIESGLRGHANHPGRGHCCATRTQAR